MGRIRLLKKPLPLPGYEDVWIRINKIIGKTKLKPMRYNCICTCFLDRLHLRNHKREECQVLYNPNNIENFDNANTMICEQTFSWLSRYKKMFCSLPKTRFHFLLHCLIKKRNYYTESCHNEGRYPLLPSVKNLVKKKTKV